MDTVNFWSVIVASIVAFGIGSLWYSPIMFGKEWMSLSKISDAEIAAAKSKGMTWLYVGQFILTLVTFVIVAFAVDIYGANGRDGALIGLLAWIGFVLPTGASAFFWENKPVRLVLINTVCTLVSLVIGGSIIGAW